VAIGTGGLLAGGAAATALDPSGSPDEMTTEDGQRLAFAKELPATEKYPNGAKVYAVTEDFRNVGYWVLLGIQGRNISVLDEDGEPRDAKISVDSFQNMKGNNNNGGGR
jgi:hypothetical protein